MAGGESEEEEEEEPAEAEDMVLAALWRGFPLQGQVCIPPTPNNLIHIFFLQQIPSTQDRGQLIFPGGMDEHDPPQDWREVLPQGATLPCHGRQIFGNPLLHCIMQRGHIVQIQHQAGLQGCHRSRERGTLHFILPCLILNQKNPALCLPGPTILRHLWSKLGL